MSLMESPARPAPRRPRAAPRNCAWFNPQSRCWSRYRGAIARDLGLSDPNPNRETLARAVARWQAAQGLSVDGVMGPRTWQLLWSRLGVMPVPAVSTQLPPDGPGFYAYATRRPHHRFGLPETIRALQVVATGWARAHPRGPRLGIGGLSLRGGGPIWGHCSHQCGIDVDLRPLRPDGLEGHVRWDDPPAYSRALTQELVDRIRHNGVLRVQFVFFNDPALRGVRRQANHDDHLHGRFLPPDDTATEASDPEALKIAERLGLDEARAHARLRNLIARPDYLGVIDTEAGHRRRYRFPDAVIDQVRQAYEDNDAAASQNRIDRAACIVMLNIGLGHLLGLRMKRWPARSTYEGRPVKSRKVLMGDLPTRSIELAMLSLQRRGLADRSIRIRFLDRRGRTAGTLEPVSMDGSVAQSVLARTGASEGWYAFGLSIMTGYHSVLLLVRRTTNDARIFWLDQGSTGINDDVTSSLDDRITKKTIDWWNAVLAEKGKRYGTHARNWRLRNPR